MWEKEEHLHITTETQRYIDMKLKSLLQLYEGHLKQCKIITVTGTNCDHCVGRHYIHYCSTAISSNSGSEGVCVFLCVCVRASMYVCVRMCVQWLILLLRFMWSQCWGLVVRWGGLSDHDQHRTIVPIKIHTKQNTSTDEEREALPQLPHNLISLSWKAKTHIYHFSLRTSA